MSILREPAAAGSFYPRFKKDVINQIEECFKDMEFGPGKDLIIPKKGENFKRSILGGICPHAGYVYSGSGNAHTLFNTFQEGMPDTVIILGTQHSGYYKTGLMVKGEWKTPLGQIPIDSELAKEILKQSDIIIEDDSAFNGYPHGREHNIEVQIPFLQYAAYLAEVDLKIIPIKIGDMEKSKLLKIAKAVSSAIRNMPSKDVVVIASSDMTHYKPQNPKNPKNEIEMNQISKDLAVIEAFKENDWENTFLKAKQTTVCGPQTIATLMIIARELGFKNTKTLKYYTSYEKAGNPSYCDYSVGYFSGIVTL